MTVKENARVASGGTQEQSTTKGRGWGATGAVRMRNADKVPHSLKVGIQLWSVARVKTIEVVLHWQLRSIVQLQKCDGTTMLVAGRCGGSTMPGFERRTFSVLRSACTSCTDRRNASASKRRFATAQMVFKETILRVCRKRRSWWYTESPRSSAPPRIG